MDQLKKFRELMSEYRISSNKCAEALGISPEAFSHKIQGLLCFSQAERETLADFLGRQIVYSAIPEQEETKYTVNANIRIIRQTILKKTLVEVAEELGISKSRQQALESGVAPSVEYLQKFGCIYHVPSNILLNIDEETWTVSEDANLIHKEADKDALPFLDMRNELSPLKKQQKMLTEKITGLIYDLDYEGMEELKDCMARIHQRHSINLQMKAYKELLKGITPRKYKVQRKKSK